MKMLSDAASLIDGQPMFKYLDRAKALELQGKSLIHMEIGEPDFDTPQNITEIACKSITDNDTHYCSSFGLTEFREVIREATQRSRGFTPDLNQVLITPGANISIFYAIFCLVNPGDEVIVPDPGFSTYYSTLKMLGVTPVRVPLLEKNNFEMDPKDIEDAITSKTRLVIINSPNNPTGSVISPTKLKKIFDVCEKHDIYLYSDEIYARMNYNETVFSSPSLYDRCKDRVIVSNGFSKAFAMTGWRLGTVIGPAEVIERMAALLQTTSSCVSPFIQKAGIEAITGSQFHVESMMSEYESRRNMLVDGLNQTKGFSCCVPGGAFYVFPNIKETNLTSDEVSEALLEAGVVVLPGNVFGENGEGYIRLCYATSRKNIAEAIKRIHGRFGTK